MLSFKKYVILVAVSLVLSLVIIRWNSTENVSFCVNVPGCQDDNPKGKITEKNYGFPLTYKKDTSFRPINNDENAANYAGYQETSLENQVFSIPSVLVNTLFWFGVLQLLSQFIPSRKPKANHDSDRDRLQN